MTDVAIRPMQPGDVPVVERLSAEGFHELDVRTYQRDWPEPSLRSPDRARAWEARTRHFLGTDPGGCWVAEGDDGIVGFATSVNRELMWILASYAVRPHLQGKGIGSQLLAAYSRQLDDTAMLSYLETDKPENVRLYERFGFTVTDRAQVIGVDNWFMVREPHAM